jgi:transposase
MSHKRRSFTPEYKEQVARMVVEESLAIPSTAREIGVNEQTLRNWVHDYRRNHAGEEPPLYPFTPVIGRDVGFGVGTPDSW